MKNNLSDFKKKAFVFDRKDRLKKFRKEFYFPKSKSGKEGTYFCGNSLGLQPKSIKKALDQELTDWKNLGVEGHFQAKTPWFSYHEVVTESLARLVGAKPNEVVAMNGLTVNLHLLMVSFYQPKGLKKKILMEGGAFPSDQYAVSSQMKFHGVQPKENIIELFPREGETTLRTEDIVDKIIKHAHELSLVLLGHVNYLTGQAFQAREIASAAHEAGAYFILDCAHSIGNLELDLHKDQVDAATWCSYKYLNSGAGGISGIFIHEKNLKNLSLPRFEGWWGTDKKTRFLMKPDFDPMPTAESWQLSNPPIFQLCALKESLKLFDRAGIKNLRKKSIHLTGFLEEMLKTLPQEKMKILTPKDPLQRGSQLSLLFTDAKKMMAALKKAHIFCDYREPGIIRVAPTALYNNYSDCYRFVEVISKYV